MDSERDAEYRLKLATGFLTEAQQDLRLQRWRSCVDNAQLSVENSAKAVIARFGAIPKSHEVGHVIDSLLGKGLIPDQLTEPVQKLIALTERLGYEEHIKTDYGEEASFLTPWEIFDQSSAQEALLTAQEALDLGKEIARMS